MARRLPVKSVARWSVMALGLTVAACGSTGGGRPDHPDASSEVPADAGIRDAGGSDGDGGGPVDGGTPVDAGTSADAGSDAGLPAACSVKPVLGVGTRIVVDTTAVGEPGTVGHQACLSVRPPDGEGNAVVHWTATINLSPPLYFESAYAPTGGAPLGTFSVTTHDATWLFPLARGWMVARETGGAPSGYLVYDVTPPEFRGGASLLGAPPFEFWPVPGGGMVSLRALAEEEGGSSCPSGGPSSESRIVINRWDAHGVKGPNGELGCYRDDSGGFIAGNARGDVLAISGGQRWHLAPDGGLTHVPAGESTAFVPLIGGVFAEYAGGWNVVDAEGNVITPGPDWLASDFDLAQLDIVLGGTAYLLHHVQTDDCGKALELVLEDGTRCGFLDVRGPSKCSLDTVAVGPEGTITALDPASCTLFVWKGALGPAPAP